MARQQSLTGRSFWKPWRELGKEHMDGRTIAALVVMPAEGFSEITQAFEKFGLSSFDGTDGRLTMPMKIEHVKWVQDIGWILIDPNTQEKIDTLRYSHFLVFDTTEFYSDATV